MRLLIGLVLSLGLHAQVSYSPGVVPSGAITIPPGTPLPPTPTLISHNSTFGNPHSTSTISTLTATALFGCFSENNGTVVSGQISDTDGNTWTILQDVSGGSMHAALAYVLNPHTSAANTVTFDSSLAGGGNSFIAFTVTAWKGIATSSAFDTQSSGGGTGSTSGTSIQPGPWTPGQTGNLQLSCLAGFQAAATNVTINSGFTIPEHTESSGTITGDLAYLTPGTLGPYNPTWTIISGGFGNVATGSSWKY